MQTLDGARVGSFQNSNAEADKAKHLNHAGIGDWQELSSSERPSLGPTKISLIAATSANDVIGAGGGIPWSIPEDMKYFRSKTLNRAIIMGRKTFESLGRELPKRLNIVISRSTAGMAWRELKENPDWDGYRSKFSEGAATVWVPNLRQALEAASDPRWQIVLPALDLSERMVIGGGDIYRQALPVTDRIYLTIVDREFEGDVRFPAWDRKLFRLSEERGSSIELPEGRCEFRFTTWDRLGSMPS